MRDERMTRLAENLLSHSVKIKEKDVLMIRVLDEGIPLAKELVRLAYEKGAYPFVRLMNSEIGRLELMGDSQERAEILKGWEEPIWKQVDANVTIMGEYNDHETSDVPAERRVAQKVLKPVQDYIVNNVRWVLLNYPTPAMAQKAGMPTDVFTDFYFDVCSMDYARLDKALQPLKELMEKTDEVHIKGPGTDLRFSIKGIPVIPCAGEYNIPDGEVYTAPVRDSVEGTVTFNTPTNYQGTTFNNVKLTFKKGKIVEATSSNTERLNEILDTDEGARYIGEFAIGVNPYIVNPMNDILFDEKITGSFHFTPGEAYDDADNGNESTIHWDMVCIQRPEYGGGEIYFDGKLIRKDGLFVPDELKGLNPDQLK
ncbi:MAG: aminopeptidase [Bacillaceae bacterium]|nr:aminopeptidase [Bacillaceae bacterium]